MSEGAKVSFQNILLTVKKYEGGRFELLYISSEIRNILTEGEKFYEEAFFEKSFPTLPRPFFEYLFQILGNGDKTICPLTWKQKYFRFVQIEGYVISQEDNSYLINVLISQIPFDSHVKFSWMLDKSEGNVFTGIHSGKALTSISEWKSYFSSKFNFISEKSFNGFLESDNTSVLSIFPGHIYLSKKVLNKDHYLFQLEYGLVPSYPISESVLQDNQTVTKQAPIYYEYDLKTDQIHFSGNLEGMLGHAQGFFENFSSKDWVNLVHPLDRHYFNIGFDHDSKIIYRINHADGSYVYVQDEVNKLLEDPNSSGTSLGIITDITALKEIEKELLEHKTILDQLTGVVPGMVYMLKAFPDGSRRFVFVSEGSKNLWELEPFTIMEGVSSIRELVHPEDLEQVELADKMAYQKNQKFESTFRIITPSGKEKWIYGASNRLKQFPKESIWAGFFIDITYTKQKETESYLLLNRYKVLFDENPLPIFQYDSQGIILDVNKQFMSKVDVKDPSQMIGKNMFDLIKGHPIKKAYKDSIEKGKGFYEGPYISHFNKKLYHVRVNAKSVEDGKVFQAILEDISEQQYVSNILSELTERTSMFSGQEFFDALTSFLSEKLNMSNCFIAEVDEKTQKANILSYYKNGVRAENFQYSLVDAPGYDCLISKDPFIIQNGAAAKYPNDTALADMGISTYMGVPIIDIDKNRLGILVLMDDKDHPYSLGLSGLLTVLSDRIGAELNRLHFEKKLISSELLFRSIAENFPNGTIEILDKDYNYVFTDGKGYQSLQIDQKKLIGTPHLSIYDKSTSDNVKDFLQKVLLGESVIFEVMVDNQYYLKNGVPLTNSSHQIDRILLVTQNITESKIAESERERLIKDLKSQNEELQRFAYIISHNLRAPIVNITSLLDLYNYKDPADEENIEIIANLKISTQILNATLEDLIEVVSIKKNKLPKIERVSFRKLLKNIERSLSKQFHESGAVIVSDYSSAPYINYIYSHLENFIINLTTNSIKYKHPDRNPVIEINCYLEEGYTVIEFTDNGIGLDLDRYKDRLFGLYQRFHSHVDGKGLGLYLIREQIRAHDGNLRVESTVGVGTTFYIHLKNMKANFPEEN
ncbi:PAS domain-containing protein [Aquiflexum sp. TKW24L]|uniref:PAS domain-containing protein n=1 Tax=Aquiflexum sp. TKW24L TaxID=2942212 RepID=UPI0020BEA189|nr:PAS domain-containing protein [Aquiflexum sp. TKW24L]MCL6258389.1 PAS domain-containing protein [Aquiflexum sp. TKW24L]